jgi:hypothetical protein
MFWKGDQIGISEKQELEPLPHPVRCGHEADYRSAYGILGILGIG